MMVALRFRRLVNLSLGSNLMGTGLIVLSGFLFTVGYSLVKVLSSSLPTAQINWARYAATCALLVCVLPWLKRSAFRALVGQGILVAQVACGLLLVASTYLFMAAVARIPLADAKALSFASPLILVLLSAMVLGERVGLARWVATIAGFVGILLIIRPGVAPPNTGTALALATALTYALYQLLLRSLGLKTGALTTFLLTIVIGTTVSSLTMPFVWVPPSPGEWILLCAMSLVQSLGQIALIVAMTHLQASVAAPFQYTQIMWAVGIGLVFFGETPDLFTILGAAVVVGSGLMLVWCGAVADQGARGRTQR